MPTIFMVDGFRFFFYSNEHHPVHVHVSYGGGEAVFEISSGVTLKTAHGMSVKSLAKAEQLAKKNIKLIKERWNVFFT